MSSLAIFSQMRPLRRVVLLAALVALLCGIAWILRGIIARYDQATANIAAMCREHDGHARHVAVGTDRHRTFSAQHPDYTLTPASELRPYRTFPYTHDVTACPRPAVSVVIPFYNADPAMFRATLQSVFRQSLQCYEIIIVDDASTKQTSIDTLASISDSRVRIIRKTRNDGLSAARNTGFVHARADLVFILDTDDMLEPTNLEKSMLYLATQPSAGFVKGFTVGAFVRGDFQKS